MSNLVDNAVKHGGKPSIAVQWNVQRGTAAHTVEVVVRDNGAGVAAADLPRIFEPFFRADPARSRQQGGSGAGLGLPSSAGSCRRRAGRCARHRFPARAWRSPSHSRRRRTVPKRILIIEDEKALASLLFDYLSADGFTVEARADGPSGLQAALSGGYDLVLLDLMLRVWMGSRSAEAAGAGRRSVLILSARREDGDKIRGLGLGADDYVVKPFSPAELVARVKHLARYERLTGRARADRWIADGGLEVNVEARRVRRNQDEIGLTAKEFDLLLLFIRNPDRAFTRDEIYSRIWGDDMYVDPSNIAVHIRRLREKIEEDPSRPGTSRLCGASATAGSRRAEHGPGVDSDGRQTPCDFSPPAFLRDDEVDRGHGRSAQEDPAIAALPGAPPGEAAEHRYEHRHRGRC